MLHFVPFVRTKVSNFGNTFEVEGARLASRFRTPSLPTPAPPTRATQLPNACSLPRREILSQTWATSWFRRETSTRRLSKFGDDPAGPRYSPSIQFKARPSRCLSFEGHRSNTKGRPSRAPIVALPHDRSSASCLVSPRQTARCRAHVVGFQIPGTRPWTRPVRLLRATAVQDGGLCMAAVYVARLGEMKCCALSDCERLGAGLPGMEPLGCSATPHGRHASGRRTGGQQCEGTGWDPLIPRPRPRTCCASLIMASLDD